MAIARSLLLLSLAIALQWDPNSEADLAGYRIYRDGELIATVGAEQTSYTDEMNGNMYFVRAINSTGQESMNSNLVVIGSVTVY